MPAVKSRYSLPSVSHILQPRPWVNTGLAPRPYVPTMHSCSSLRTASASTAPGDGAMALARVSGDGAPPLEVRARPPRRCARDLLVRPRDGNGVRYLRGRGRDGDGSSGRCWGGTRFVMRESERRGGKEKHVGARGWGIFFFRTRAAALPREFYSFFFVGLLRAGGWARTVLTRPRRDARTAGAGVPRDGIGRMPVQPSSSLCVGRESGCNKKWLLRAAISRLKKYARHKHQAAFPRRRHFITGCLLVPRKVHFSCITDG